MSVFSSCFATLKALFLRHYFYHLEKLIFSEESFVPISLLVNRRITNVSVGLGPFLSFNHFLNKYFHFFLKKTKSKVKKPQPSSDCSESPKVSPMSKDLEALRPKLLQRINELYQRVIPANTKIQVRIKNGAKKTFEVTCPVDGCNVKLKPYFGIQNGSYRTDVSTIRRHIKGKHSS